MTERPEDRARCPQLITIAEARQIALKAMYEAEYQRLIERAFDAFEASAPSDDAPPSPLTSTLTWIPVSERLPEDQHVVLLHGMTASRENRTDVGWHIKGDWYGYIRVPTHWSELPPPPASEEEKG